MYLCSHTCTDAPRGLCVLGGPECSNVQVPARLSLARSEHSAGSLDRCPPPFHRQSRRYSSAQRPPGPRCRRSQSRLLLKTRTAPARPAPARRAVRIQKLQGQLHAALTARADRGRARHDHWSTAARHGDKVGERGPVGSDPADLKLHEHARHSRTRCFEGLKLLLTSLLGPTHRATRRDDASIF
jgi:hypothetical protein